MKKIAALILFAIPLLAQNPIQVAPLQVIDGRTGAAKACSGCQIFSYLAGTNTRSDTYTDYTVATPNTNPVLTNAQGYAVANDGITITGIWPANTRCYKFVLEDDQNVVIWTQDHLCSAQQIIIALLALPSGSSLIGFQQVGGIATTVQSALRYCPFDVQYANLATAIANIPAYGCLNMVGSWTLTSGITISGSHLTMYGQPGSLITNGANITPITITGSYNTLEGININGAHTAHPTYLGLGIYVSGASAVTDITIRGGSIYDTGKDPIYAQDNIRNLLIDGVTADASTSSSSGGGAHAVGIHTATAGAVMSNITVQNSHLKCGGTGQNACIEVGNFGTVAYNTTSNPTNVRSLNNDLTFVTPGAPSFISYQLIDSGTIDGNTMYVGGLTDSFGAIEIVLTIHTTITNNKVTGCLAAGNCGIILNSGGGGGARNGGLAGSWNVVSSNDIQGQILLQSQYATADNSYNLITNNKIKIPSALVTNGAILLFNNVDGGITSHNTISGNQIVSNGLQTANTGCLTTENVGVGSVMDGNIWSGNHATGCPYIWAAYAASSTNNAVFSNLPDASLVSGTYTSGGSITGSAAQTCTLTFPIGLNEGNGLATATVALTGANTIAGGTALTITNAGGGFTSSPASATLGNGTASCSGTATIATVINMGNTFGASWNFVVSPNNLIAIGSTGSPTCVTGAGLDGTGGVSCTANTAGTPYSGEVTLDASGVPVLSGTVFTLTFPSGAFTSRPYCTFSPTYVVDAADVMAKLTYSRASTATTGIWQNLGASALTAGSHYWIAYSCPKN